jgi:hypothetical protein
LLKKATKVIKEIKEIRGIQETREQPDDRVPRGQRDNLPC